MKRKHQNYRKPNHGAKKRTIPDKNVKKLQHIQRNKNATERMHDEQKFEMERIARNRQEAATVLQQSCQIGEESSVAQLMAAYKSKTLPSSEDSDDESDESSDKSSSDLSESEGDDGSDEEMSHDSRSSCERLCSEDDGEKPEKKPKYYDETADSDDDQNVEMSNLRPEETKKTMATKKVATVLSKDEENDREIAEISDDESTKPHDMFAVHLDHDINPEILECISAQPPKIVTSKISTPALGRLQIDIPKLSGESQTKKKKKHLLDDEQIYASEGTVPKMFNLRSDNIDKLSIHKQIKPNLEEANKKIPKKSSAIFTDLQAELLSIFSNYQDLYFPQRSLENGEEVRVAYCIHALNHILKTRARVILHNNKVAKSNSALIPDGCRDQGMVRPKVLILVPFRDSALKVVTNLIHLLFSDGNGTVMNIKRFLDEYSGESLHFPVRVPKPEDYEKTFGGNTDDTFRMGIAFTKKTIKLYTDFYSSDILIASPLGLRMIIGAAGDKERDYDFLASIELLIMDQCDLFYAQNWDHLLHCLDHLHLQPQSARNTDFSRVRSWCLNGLSRFYRQSLIFSTHDAPEFRSIFNSRCANYRGKIRVANPIVSPSVRHVTMAAQQVFHKVEVSSIDTSYDQRFNHFINVVLPQYKNVLMAGCLVYIPSYFDYVRVRNYFKKETMSFVQICEYTKDAKMARARDMFFHGSAHFMLYSERAHFFRRTRIKGIRHIIFYQPPSFPHFYPEMINLMHTSNRQNSIIDEPSTVTVMFTKYDMIQVAAIIGTERAAKIGGSDKKTHMFLTEE